MFGIAEIGIQKSARSHALSGIAFEFLTQISPKQSFSFQIHKFLLFTTTLPINASYLFRAHFNSYHGWVSVTIIGCSKHLAPCRSFVHRIH